MQRILCYNKRVREYFDKSADDYDIRHSQYNTTFGYIEKMRRECVMWIIRRRNKNRILDAGCGTGYYLKALSENDVFGIDISKYAISQVREDIKPYCKVSSILDPFPEKYYDLIVCIEILEHLPEEDARKAIKNLYKHTDDIIFFIHSFRFP